MSEGKLPSAAWMTCTASNSRSEEHTSELQSLRHLVCRLLLEKKKDLSGSSLSACNKSDGQSFGLIPFGNSVNPSYSSVGTSYPANLLFLLSRSIGPPFLSYFIPPPSSSPT